MFNVGGPEVLVILVVALIALGPAQLPKAARQVGQVMTEIRKVSNGFQRELTNAFEAEERRDETRTEKPQSPGGPQDPAGPHAGAPAEHPEAPPTGPASPDDGGDGGDGGDADDPSRDVDGPA